MTAAEYYAHTVDLYVGEISKMTNIQGREAQSTASPVPFNNGVVLSSEEEEVRSIL